MERTREMHIAERERRMATCMITPSFNTTILVPNVIASV